MGNGNNAIFFREYGPLVISMSQFQKRAMRKNFAKLEIISKVSDRFDLFWISLSNFPDTELKKTDLTYCL